MGRRVRLRWVKETPRNFYFNNIIDNSVILSVAEFEAMRLKHYLALNQKEAAEKMGISQPTFSRILESAHKKTTQALMEGKPIRVYGGEVFYKKGFVGYGCLKCGAEWEDESASTNKQAEKQIICPKCASNRVYFLQKEPL
ncbi:MAG: DUF134 domain-containing protein [Promethearchaeota archaeon]